jgi:hypothetical protein
MARKRTMKIPHSAVEFPGMRTAFAGYDRLTIDLIGFFKIGGPCRDRTYDQLIKSQLLYQLS